MYNAGMVRPGSTVYIPINTFSSDDPSASVTATTWVNTDCHIHKDGGTTQRASSAGETLSIDFDTITGNHLLAVDTSDNTTANFYEAGSTYHVRIEGATVDGAAINAWIGTFEIGYPNAILNTTIATLSTQTGFTLEDASTSADAYNGCPCVIHDLASATEVAIGFISDYAVTTKTVTLAADPGVFTMAAGDSISIFMPSNVLSWHNTPLGTTDPLPSQTPGTTDGLPTYDNLVAMVQLLARKDAAIATDRSSELTKINADQGSGAGAYDQSRESQEGIRDQGDSAWAGSPPTIMQTTTIATLASQTSFTLTAGSADDDAYNDAFALVVDQTTAVQQCICDITNYTGASKTVTLGSDPGVFTMATGDTIYIIAAAPGTAAPTAAAVADAVLTEVVADHTGTAGSLAKIIDNIEGDTNELQTDDYPTSIAAIKAETALIVADTAELQTDDVPGLIAALDVVVDRVEADTQDLQTQVGTAGAGLTDLGGMSTAMKGEVNTEADAAFATYDPPTKTEMDSAFTEIKGATWASGTDTLEHIRNKQTDIEADTNELQSDDIPGTLAAMDTKLDTIDNFLDTEIAAIVAKLPTNYIMGSADQEDHDDEIDALVTAVGGTLSEITGAASIPATPTIKQAIMLLYMYVRNAGQATSSERRVMNDAGTEVLDATMSDNGTTFDQGELTDA